MHRAIRTCFLCGSLSLAWLAAGPARGQSCAPLQLLDQIGMVPVNDTTTMLIPVTMNGTAKFMIFDTGASASSVTRALANELGLSVHPSLRPNPLFDAYGDVSRDVTTVRDFKLGRQDVCDARFRIWPNPDLENADARLAGVLSLDQLLQYDIDVDFPAGVLKLFSPDHCDGKILYWKADAVAVSTFNTRGGHINIVATLDGQKLNAIVDSGAPNSFLSTGAARRFFGLAADSPWMRQSATLTRNSRYPVYQHQFSELDFNGVAVSKPVIAIWPDIMDRNTDRSLQDTQNRAIPMSVGVNPPQLVIGTDILSKLHIYIETRERRIYFSGSAASSTPSK
jgi:predicted aspartyl protease